MMFNLYKLFEDSIADSWFSFLRVLDDPKFRAVAAVILSFLFVVLLGKRTIRWLIKQKIGDAPEFYNADLNKMTRHKASTPTMGGILISGAILVCTLLLADLGNFYIRVGIICLICFTALGSIDDWLKLTSARRGPADARGLRVGRSSSSKSASPCCSDSSFTITACTSSISRSKRRCSQCRSSAPMCLERISSIPTSSSCPCGRSASSP